MRLKHRKLSKIVQLTFTSSFLLLKLTSSSSLRLTDNYHSPNSHKFSTSSQNKHPNLPSHSDQLILLDDDLLPNYNHDSTSPHIYTVTSKYLYSGESQDVCLYFTNFPDLDQNQHFKISASLSENDKKPSRDYRNYYQKSPKSKPAKVVFVKKVKQSLGLKKCFKIRIPEVDSEQIYNLKFSVRYGLNNEVHAENLIKIRPSFPVVFITTDKPVYKPSQTIRYKILVLDRFMKPFRRAMKPHLVEVFISNPNKIKLDSKSSGIWLDQYGMYSGEFNLIDDPSIGDWTLGVKLQKVKSSVAKITTYKTEFAVQKYNLPKFDIEITGLVRYNFQKR